MTKNMELIQITWCIALLLQLIFIDIEKYLYLLMKIIDYKWETSLTYPIM